MNLALWIMQGLVAAAMLGAGAFKLVTPKPKLEKKLKWARTWEPGGIKLLGMAEILGAVGLVVPWATGILPFLTPVAAACLAVLMFGAVVTHLRLKESPLPPLVLLILCVVIALGRYGVLGSRGSPVQKGEGGIVVPIQ